MICKVIASIGKLKKEYTAYRKNLNQEVKQLAKLIQE
jgi:hypothetical protein